MRGFRVVLFVWSVLLFNTLVSADEVKEIQFDIPAINASALSWGRHTFPIKITNNGEYLKYITVFTSVKCDGLQTDPERMTSKNFAIFPGDTANSEIVLVVPGNYGKFTYELKLYDVVDTLDNLLESQVIEKQEGIFQVSAPITISPYLVTEITLPPLVGRHVDFDNDFSHVLPFLISEGKSVSEIAKMAGCETSFVIAELGYMISRGYYEKDSSRYLTAIAAITEAEAAKGKKLALKVAESLAAKLTENFKTYQNVLDSLVKAELLTADSNSFMDGGVILYKPYPVITALSLWYDMGASFISAGAPLHLYDGTDFCNAYLPDYMYMVAGTPENNGRQLFAFMRNYRSYQIYFGDTIPRIYCPEGFMFSPQMGVNVVWEYEQHYYPEGFIVDTNQVRPMLNHLRRGIDPILKDAFEKLSAIGVQHKKTFLLFGQRYWFWNMVSTKTVEILVANGTISRRGNGQFRMDGMSVK